MTMYDNCIDALSQVHWYITVHVHVSVELHHISKVPVLLDGWRRELNGGHMTLVPCEYGKRGRGLGTPHSHWLVQTARGYHGVVTAERDVRHFSRVSPQGGQKLTCLTRPHLKQVIVCTLEQSGKVRKYFYWCSQSSIIFSTSQKHARGIWISGIDYLIYSWINISILQYPRFIFAVGKS